MKKVSKGIIFILLPAIFIFSRCKQSQSDETANKKDSTQVASTANGGFESQVKWGARLVTIAGCNDCHTPKKMGPNGPEDDMSLMLSGHPAQQPPPDFDVKEAAKKGLILTQSFTAWMGPWGITYAANITSDSTGIGMWTEAQFIKALKEKKWMGLDNTRPLMPPMSMMPATLMSDDELKAIFAYLKTTPPIKNVQPTAMLLPPPARK
jgi:predicted CxxxxCH...CXXCH cytochrome family protein